MKTNIKTVALFVAVAVLADGKFDERERNILKEIADIYMFDTKEFEAAVDNEVKSVKGKSEEDVTVTLEELGKDVSEDEKGILFECVLEIILSDGELSSVEVVNLLAVAEALGMRTEQAVLLLADMIKTEPDMKVEL